MKRLQAERTLQAIKYRNDVKLRAETFYQLVLDKTEDEELAQLATGEYMKALVRQDQKVE